MIRVAVHGAAGKMGQEVLRAVVQDQELEVVGGVDIQASQEWLSLPDGRGTIPYSSSVETILSRSQPHVLVDFSVSEATMVAARAATQHRVNLVIGTTGLTPQNVEVIKGWVQAQGVGAVVAPNFALGAVIMIYLARLAARFFEAAEII